MITYYAGVPGGGKPGDCRREQQLVPFWTNRLWTYYWLMKDRGQMTKDNSINLFLDSGAFSAWTKGESVNIKNYIKFIKQHQDVIDIYANLDVIGLDGKQPNERTAKQTLRNQRIMEKAGLNPMPVFHIGEPYEYLDYYVENYEYISLGIAGNIPKNLVSWLDECFANHICDQHGLPKIKVHGFAVTSLQLMVRYPWYCMTEEDHQVFTKTGWKFYSQLYVGEEILAFANGKQEWQKIEEIPVFNVKNSPIYHLHNRNIEAFVSGNHRWLVSDQNKKDHNFKFVNTTDLKQSHCINRVGKGFAFQEQNKFSIAFIELLAWFWTDGTINKKKRYKTKSITIYQSQTVNPKKCERITNCLNSLSAQYCTHTSKDGIIHFEIYGDISHQILQLAPDKKLKSNLPYLLTKKQAEIFLECSILADGTKTGLKRINGFEIVVKRDYKKHNIDVLRNICLLLGIPTSVFFDKKGCKGLRSSSVTHLYSNQIKKDIISYTGKLWCVRVKSGAFFTKCKNHIYVTGNSVDSTSWVVVGRNGKIIVPKRKGGQWIYDQNSDKISVSFRSPDVHKKGQHLLTMSKKEQKRVYDYIADKGYKLGDSEFVKMPVSHQLEENQRWADKKEQAKDGQRLMEIIKEPGLGNQYLLRDEINIQYFQDLEQFLPAWPWPFKKQIDTLL